jgi:hypothetical protein
MRDLLAWVASYLIVSAVFFGVLSASIDNDKWGDVKLSTLIVSSLIWRLTTIAAIAYKLSEWGLGAQRKITNNKTNEKKRTRNQSSIHRGNPWYRRWRSQDPQ